MAGWHSPTPGTDREYLVEIYAALGGLRMDIDRMQKVLGEIPLHCQAENVRIGALEQWRWTLTGGLSLLTFALGIIGAIVVNHLFHLVP